MDSYEEERKQLLDCVRFDKLPNDMLIELSKGKNEITKGFE